MKSLKVMNLNMRCKFPERFLKEIKWHYLWSHTCLPMSDGPAEILKVHQKTRPTKTSNAVASKAFKDGYRSKKQELSVRLSFKNCWSLIWFKTLSISYFFHSFPFFHKISWFSPNFFLVSLVFAIFSAFPSRQQASSNSKCFPRRQPSQKNLDKLSKTAENEVTTFTRVKIAEHLD